jgi:ABC-type transport system involved in multi-copper enzyme maturation permease subunit
MNPMIRKELRQRMRERRSWVLPSLYLVALGGVIALTYFFSTQESFVPSVRERQGAQIGVAVFFTVAYAQMALLLLLAPVFSAGSLTIEKEQRTLAGLLTSLLSPFEIWWGKFVSAMLFLILLLVSALPALSLVFSLGGVGPEELLRATAMTLLVLASISAIGLYFSSTFRRSVHSTAVSYAAVIALTLVTFVVFTLLQYHWQSTHQAAAAASGNPMPEMPRYLLAPLWLNPFYALTSAFMHGKEKFPEWLASGLVFLGLGIAAILLALRNISRGGERG